MRSVFDTNVVISALLLPDSKPRRAFDLALQEGELLLSVEVLTELHDVLHRKQFRRYVGEDEVRNFLAALIRESRWVEVDQHITLCRDPKDNKFLELAVTGGATHLVTGDSDLLTLDPFRGIRILQPDAFLQSVSTG